MNDTRSRRWPTTPRSRRACADCMVRADGGPGSVTRSRVPITVVHRRSGGPADRGDGGGGPRQLVARPLRWCSLAVIATVDDVPVGPAALRPVLGRHVRPDDRPGSAGRGGRGGVGRSTTCRPVLLCGLSVVVLGVDILTGASPAAQHGVPATRRSSPGGSPATGNQAFSILTIRRWWSPGLWEIWGGGAGLRRRRLAGGRGGGVPGGDRARGVPAMGALGRGRRLASIPVPAIIASLAKGIRIRFPPGGADRCGDRRGAGALAALDPARPVDSQTHLGTVRPEAARRRRMLILQRKIDANASILTSATVWTLVIPVLLFVGYRPGVPTG